MAFVMVLRAINVFSDFFAQKISRIVTIKNWREISDIKSGVGGGWGCVGGPMPNGKCYLKFPDLFFEPFPKEYGLNRETRRFMNIQFSVDKFHESNHTSCGKTFNSSEYVSLSDKNSQACEQVNAKLRTIATTCTFMNPDMFMRSISLFLSYQNTKNSE